MTKKDFKSCWESGNITPVAFAVFCSEYGEMDYNKFCRWYSKLIPFWDTEVRGKIWREAGLLVELAPRNVKSENRIYWCDVITAEWLGDFKQIQTNE